MPEASLLYSVTGVVVLGLVAWVGWVLTTAKEPWAREVAVAPAVVSEQARPDEARVEQADVAGDAPPPSRPPVT
ncbi:MAG: hypothetical protein JWP97_2418 [Labilithrix sp.]|nr:hypothetical protein [Labilithrix sp.]